MKTTKKTLALYKDSKYGTVTAFHSHEGIGDNWNDYYRISKPVEIEFPLLDNPDQFRPDALEEAERELARAEVKVERLRAEKLRGEQ